MQDILKLSVIKGVEIKQRRVAINRWSNVGENQKLMSLEEAIFCTLHLELCVNKGKIGGLLNKGFTHCQTGRLVDKYVQSVQQIVNRGNHGQATQQNQWRFPLVKDKKSVETGFSMKNNLSRAMFGRINEIIVEALKFHRESYREE